MLIIAGQWCRRFKSSTRTNQCSIVNWRWPCALHFFSEASTPRQPFVEGGLETWRFFFQTPPPCASLHKSDRTITNTTRYGFFYSIAMAPGNAFNGTRLCKPSRIRGQWCGWVGKYLHTSRYRFSELSEISQWGTNLCDNSPICTNVLQIAPWRWTRFCILIKTTKRLKDASWITSGLISVMLVNIAKTNFHSTSVVLENLRQGFETHLQTHFPE